MEILFLKMNTWEILPQETTKDILLNILHLPSLFILVNSVRPPVTIILDFTVNNFDRVLYHGTPLTQIKTKEENLFSCAIMART